MPVAQAASLCLLDYYRLAACATWYSSRRLPTIAFLEVASALSAVETLSQLVSINSVNSFYRDGPGEASVAEFVLSFFRERGIESTTQSVLPGRTNVIARLPGKDPSRRVLLEAHMDTVSVEGMSIPPFVPTIEDGKLFGRGACDTKGGLAAMMHAVADLKQSGQKPPCEVWMCAVVDEEFSFLGVQKLCDGLRADAALVAEPTEMRVAIASKGVLRWRIVASGVAAHSSKAHLGVNAIHHMARLVLALERYHESLLATVHPMLGSPSGNVGIIQGGVQVNFVPDRCFIEIDRRMLPGESVENVLLGYQSIVDQIQQAEPKARFDMEQPMLIDHAMATDPNAAVATCAQRTLSQLGREAHFCGVPFGSDASKLSRQGIPSVIIGPGSIDRAHAAIEYVELDQVELAFEFYRRFLLNFE